MANPLTAQEAGLEFGTQVTITAAKIPPSTPLSPGITLSLSGEKCTAITRTFDRAGYNHYDEVYAYCFTLPSREELWIELPDRLTKPQRIDILREFFTWQ